MNEETSVAIRDKIIHVLKIYPKLSPSMLHIALGTSLPTSIWRPVLEEMIAECVVLSNNETHEAPSGRNQTYNVLTLADD